MTASDWLTILIAATAAAASILAALFAGHQALAAGEQSRSAQKQLELAERARRDQAQPYVFADIRPDTNGFLMMLVVENTGPTVARNVHVAFDPPLKSAEFPEVSNLLLLRDGIAALPPGRRISWYFDTGPGVFNNDVPRKYRVTISADGPFGSVERLEYDIDFSVLERSAARDSGRLKDISEQLKKMSQTLERIHRGLRPQ